MESQIRQSEDQKGGEPGRQAKQGRGSEVVPRSRRRANPHLKVSDQGQQVHNSISVIDLTKRALAEDRWSHHQGITGISRPFPLPGKSLLLS